MFRLLGFLFWSIMCFAGGSILTVYGAYSIIFSNGIDNYNSANNIVNSVISKVIPSNIITRTSYSNNTAIPIPINDIPIYNSNVVDGKNNITDEQFNQYIVQQALIQNNKMDKNNPSILDFTDRELYNYFLIKEVEMFNNSHDFKHHR